MKKILLSIAAILTIFMNVFSQESGTRTDYVVLHSDTLRGFIKTQNFENTPETISFRKSETDPWTNYSPFDIAAFSVAGFSFEAKKLKTDFSSKKQNDIITNSFQNRVIDTTLFVKVVLKNKIVSLYLHRDIYNQPHFFIEKDINVPEELIQKCWAVTQTITCKNLYWATLRLNTMDCASVTDAELKLVKLEEGSLKRILMKYIRCKGGEIILNKGEGKNLNVLSIYFAPGVTMPTFDNGGIVVNTKHEGLANANFGSAFTIQAGVSYEYFPALNSHFSYGAELGIRFYDAKADYTSVNSTSNPLTITTRQIYDLNPTYLKLTPSVKYRFNDKGLSPYLRFGLMLNYSISFSSSYKGSQRFGNNPETITNSEGLTSDEFKKSEIGYFLAFGVKKSRIGLELRLERGDGLISVQPDLTSKTQTASLYLSYSLKNKK